MPDPDGQITPRLSDYISETPEISEAATYWFFRTDRGALFEPFITSQSIAIGWPSISLETLKNLVDDERSKELLVRQIKNADPRENRPGLSAGQLLRFTHVLKQGDYVIIPSMYSHELAIGRITDSSPFDEPIIFEGNEVSGYNKRRKVRWMKRVHRAYVNPNLNSMLYAHQTMTDVSECSQWIDTLLFDFFKKGNDYHYVLEINRTDGINARDLFQSCVDLFKLVDGLKEEFGIQENADAIDTRINLNSPGEIELITTAAQYICLFGMAVIGLIGGRLRFSVKRIEMNVDIGTDGAIKAISKFLNDRKNRELSDSVKQKFDSLQITDSEAIIKMIEKINKRR